MSYCGEYEMTNIPKQTEFWIQSAQEDFEVGSSLINSGKIRHGLFFIHLAVEKILKACVCKNQNKTPPKIHNLLRLAELAGLKLENEQEKLLAEINEFNLEGRYPLDYVIQLEKSMAIEYIKKAQEILECFKPKL